MKRILLLILLLLLAWLGFELWKAFGPVSAGDRRTCESVVARKVRFWKLLHWDKARIDRAYDEALLVCLGGDKKLAGVLPRVNHDRAELGRRFLSGELAPDEYLARLRDRTRKLRNAKTIPGWIDSLAKGDRDGDLVPDDRDDCPDSPPLSATDDRGCPQKGPLPKAPTREDVERAKNAMHVAISPPCQDAAPPSSSTALQIGRDQNDPDSFFIAVSKVAEEPAKCPVFYDIRIRSQRSSFFAQTHRAAHFYFAFRSAENVDHSPAAQYRNVFRVRKQNIPNWNDLVAVAIEPSDREDRIVEVRTLNGSGASRGWSAPRTFSMNPATQFFPAF